MNWVNFCERYIPTAKRIYKEKFGRELRLDNPLTFTEKVQWLKIYDSSYLKTFCADKISLHNYCTKVLGHDICIPICNIYANVANINFDTLPNQYVLKCNHGSGYNIICKNKNSMNIQRTKELLCRWLDEDYSEKQGCELHYKLIPHKCFCEQYMTDGHSDLTDYKIYCFNGIDIFTQVIQDRNTKETMTHFLPGWIYTNKYDQKGFNSNKTILPPPCYDQMIQIARQLSKPFKMVRVDFYWINQTLYLGELTFTPYSGYHQFQSDHADYELGEMLLI